MIILPQEIGRLATQAILYEAAVSPKPGLVDRRNAGAHKDMDVFTFLASAAALSPYFVQFAQIGMEHVNQDPKTLLRAIRKVGMEAEQAMLGATAGVNTHKGAIFSLGLICAAAGSLAAANIDLEPQPIADYVSDMTRGICEREYQGVDVKQKPTKGEQIYLKYGLRGVRGEAQDGFPNVMKYSYPVLKRCLLQKQSGNTSMLQAYLHLAGNVDDTNVLGRHDMEMSNYVKAETKRVLALGGALEQKNMVLLEEMDDDFINKNISPGGCADLLAVTLFLFFLANPLWKYKV